MEDQFGWKCSKGFDQNSGMHLKWILDAMTISWNQLSSSSQLSIALPGDLTATAAVTQKDSASNGRFLFLRHPECFLLLVWRTIHISKTAFDTAFTSMEEIEKLTGQILYHLRHCASSDVRELGQMESTLLPIARGCYRAARETHEAFQRLSVFIAEVMDTCDATKSPEVLHMLQKTASQKAFEIKSSHVEDLMKALSRSLPRLNRIYSDSLAALKKVENEKPSFRFLCAASIIDTFSSLFQGGTQGPWSAYKIMSSSYNAELECVFKLVKEKEENLRQVSRQLATLKETDSKLKNFDDKLELTSGFTKIDPEPTLELLEQARSKMESFEKLTIELMDCFEILLEVIHGTGQKEELSQLFDQMNPFMKSCKFIHNMAKTFCKTWNDNLGSNFRQMESLIEEQDLSSDPDKVRVNHGLLHHVADLRHNKRRYFSFSKE